MSYQVASSISEIANAILLISLVVGVIATFVIVQTATVKEAQWDKERVESAKQIAELSLQSEELRRETAEANRIAEEERLARVKIEEKLAPRRISQKDQNYISQQISMFRDVVGGIGSSPGDIESIRLESAIHAAASMGGWKLDRAIPSHTPMWPGGVVVSSSSDKKNRSAAVRLALALNSVGVFTTYMPMFDAKAPQVFVTIGPKPESDDPLLLLNLESLKEQASELGLE